MFVWLLGGSAWGGEVAAIEREREEEGAERALPAPPTRVSVQEKERREEASAGGAEEATVAIGSAATARSSAAMEASPPANLKRGACIVSTANRAAPPRKAERPAARRAGSRTRKNSRDSMAVQSGDVTPHTLSPGLNTGPSPADRFLAYVRKMKVSSWIHPVPTTIAVDESA